MNSPEFSETARVCAQTSDGKINRMGKSLSMITPLISHKNSREIFFLLLFLTGSKESAFTRSVCSQ